MKFLLFFLIFSCNLFCQQKISGIVLDKTTKQPISFVSIGIIGKMVGTVSDEKGVFEFNYTENPEKDSLKIYAIGYKPLVFLVAGFLKEPNKHFFLESLPTQLEEVVVKSKKIKYETIGTTHYSKNNCTGFADIEGNWKGSEAAILVKNKKNILFEAFGFYVIQNKYQDSLLFRLNFYEKKLSQNNTNVSAAQVGNTLLKKPIIFKVGIKQGGFILPLKNYNIQTAGDFFISLECLMDEMDIAKFCYSGTYAVESFFKVKAFSGWQKTRGGGGDFNVKVSFTD